MKNEVGLAARRSGQKLTDAEMEAADVLVAKGQPPAEAVKAVLAQRPTPPPATPAATPKPAPKAARSTDVPTEDELPVYMRLIGQGKTHEDAMQVLSQQRKLAGKLGTPSTDTVRKKVAKRNVTGRWDKE